MSERLIEMDSLPQDSNSCSGVESEVSVKSGSREAVKKTVTDGGVVSPAVAKQKSSSVLRKKFYVCCEVTVLTPIMMLIIGLFTIPRYQAFFISCLIQQLQ